MRRNNLILNITCGLLLSLLMMLPGSTMAQVRPAMSLFINWTPNEQLTSIPDDERFIDMQVYITGNIQFWALDLVCTVGRGTELSFVSFTPAPAWGSSGEYFLVNPAAGIYNGSQLAFTLTRVGINNAPIGQNGRDYTLLLGSVRFRANDLTQDARVSASCRTMNFLDRDGNLAVRGRQTRLNDLMIRIGYTINGTVLRQGARDHRNIEVTCTHQASSTIYGPVFTSSNGRFTFGGVRTSSSTDLVRQFGLYQCDYTSRFSNGEQDTVYLQGRSRFDLRTPAYRLMPVQLRTGELNSDGEIAFDDLAVLTSLYGTTAVSAYRTGDTNGDRRVDNVDLALVAGNVGVNLDEAARLAEHVIYGVGRDYDVRAIFPNSKIWWGDPTSGQVYSLLPRSRTRDFWPKVSPDGRELAFVSVNARTGLHELAIGDMDRGSSSLFRVPRGFNRHAFAPSWSPDGNRLAFICTVDNPANQRYEFNEGEICLVNRADTSGISLTQVGNQTEIFPVAWLPYLLDDESTAYVILYAHANRIHYYDLASGLGGLFPTGGLGVNDIVDMPVVVSHHSGENILFYRYNDGVTTRLRAGRLAYDGISFTGPVAAVPDGVLHVDISDTTGLDYYAVSPNLELMYYLEYNYSLANYPTRNPYQFYNLYRADALSNTLGWLPGGAQHYVDGAIGHPTWNAFTGPGLPWNGDPDIATLLHIHRMSFDWIP